MGVMSDAGVPTMRYFALLISVLAVAACTEPAGTSATSAAPSATPSIPVAAAASGQDAGLTGLINAFRASEGRGPVAAVPSLKAASLNHAQDMVTNGFFSHSSPNGDSVGDRVRAAGCSWSGVAENIAQGQSTPQQAMETWINSTGHRANLLGPYSQIGPSRIGNTWVLVFASGC